MDDSYSNRPKRMHHFSVAVCGVTALLLGACSGVDTQLQQTFSPVPHAAPVDEGGVLSTAADTPDLRERLTESTVDELTSLYLSAELDMLDGQFTRASERFGEVLTTSPNSLEGVISARRLFGLQDTAAEGGRRAADIVNTLAGNQLNPLTATYFNMLAIEAGLYSQAHLGMEDSGPFSAESLGLPDEWRFAGHFSRLPRLHFEREEAFEQDLVLADHYAPDGRDVTTQLLFGDEARLAIPGENPGTYVLETWAHLEANSERLVLLDSNEFVRLTINGEEVLDRAVTDGYPPVMLLRPVYFHAGWHRIRIVVGSSSGSASLAFQMISPTVGEPGLTFSARPPDGVVLSSIVMDEHDQHALHRFLPESVLNPSGPLEALALLQLSTDFRFDQLLFRAVEYFSDLALSPVVQVAIATAYEEVQTLSPTDGRNLHLQLVRNALSTAPSAVGVALYLASTLIDDGRADEALGLLRSVQERLAGEYIVNLALYRLYSYEGWDELAEQALEAALVADPESCWVVQRLGELYAHRSYFPESSNLAPGFRSCDAGIEYQIEREIMPSGDIDSALAAWRVLALRHPSDDTYHRRLFDLFMFDGRFSEAWDVLEQASQVAFNQATRTVMEADWLLAQDMQVQAESLLEEALRRHSAGDYGLMRLNGLLVGADVLDDLRVDTLEAIEQYEQRHWDSRADAVYALDYGAYRYFENGSSLMLIHQIVHIRTRDALGEWGEIGVPQDAILLNARTIKADGTICETDNIPGMDTLSMANLEVGDYVEYEYVQPLGTSLLRLDTIVGDRFYFQVPALPMARSEMIVDVPVSWSPLDLDIRAQGPQPVITEVGNFRRHRFLVEEMETPSNESNTPDLDELLPSVRYSHSYGWDDVRDLYLDWYLDVVRPTTEIEEVARGLIDGSENDRQAVSRIFRFVVDEIEELGGFLETDAIWTLHMGEGERLPLLLALLQSAGFPFDLVFLRSWANDQIDSPVPDAASYPYTAVRVDLDDEEVWLDPVLDFASFDFLTPDLQGTDALIISGDLQGPVEHAQVPTWPQETNTHHLELTLTLDEFGAGAGTLREQVTVEAGPLYRSFLESVENQLDLAQVIENMLSQSFPGLRVSNISFEGLEDPDSRLTLIYVFVTPGFAEIVDDEMTIDARLFDPNLLNIFGGTTDRQFPLAINQPLSEVLELVLELPADFRFTQIPESVELGEPWMRYSRVVEENVERNQLQLTRIVEIDPGRIVSSDYSAFVLELRAIDQAEALHIRAQR